MITDLSGSALLMLIYIYLLIQFSGRLLSIWKHLSPATTTPLRPHQSFLLTLMGRLIC